MSFTLIHMMLEIWLKNIKMRKSARDTIHSVKKSVENIYQYTVKTRNEYEDIVVTFKFKTKKIWMKRFKMKKKIN